MITSYYTTKISGPVLEPETIAYRDRVLAEPGAEVIDLAYVDLCYKEIKVKNVTVDYSWLSASFGVKKDVNNKVSKLYSLAGANFDLVQNTGSNQPTWVSNGMGGLPEIQFISAQFMVSKSGLIYSQPNTIIVGGASAGSTVNGYFYDSLNDSSKRHCCYRNANSSAIVVGSNTGTVSINPIDGSPRIITALFKGNLSKTYNNDTLIEGSLGNTEFQYITLGYAYVKNRNYSTKGPINDFLFISNETDLVSFRDFINNRYNIF